MNIDANIETRERCISFLNEELDIYRTDDHTWVEWFDYASQRHAHHVAEQAVLFAVKEGL